MARLLITIRGDLTQTEAGCTVGLSQAKVSRAEQGRFPLAPDQADAYARACSATATQRRHLVQLATAFAVQNVTTRAALVRSARAIHERAGQLETESALIRSWQPELVPGILPTATYTATMLAGDSKGTDPEPHWWAARTLRTAKVHEPGRIWHQLVSEAVLRWPLGSAAVMAEQMKHLIEVSALPNVRLGILDFATPKPLVPPPAFHLFGSRTVSVTTDVGTTFLTDPHDVHHYEQVFADLDELALHSDRARALLSRVLAGLPDRPIADQLGWGVSARRRAGPRPAARRRRLR